MENVRKIGDLVEVRAHPTVVRLADAQNAQAAWIERSYLLTDEVRGHLQALRHAFARDSGCGIFLIGHYGAGKSHFLAYLQRRLRHGDFGAPTPSVMPVSLLNFRSEMALEDVLLETLELEGGSGDRRVAWGRLAELYPQGLVLMLDELSEFLRAKPTPQAFHEDIRFLQFLGELTQDRRLWVIGAMQEQIEHTGDLEYGLYRKIKDRFALRLLLSPAHVRELLADSILVKLTGYGPAVERLAADLYQAFPDSHVDFADLTAIYPLHPATLELLEEVRERFSSARGVVDFTVYQLQGHPERGIEPFLDKPWGSLLTPDYIVDHFRDLLDVQPDFLPLAQKLFPHYRKRMSALFPQAARQQLAWRLLKLLVLVHLSPEREHLSAQQAAAWLLFKLTRVDPARNLALVGKTLEQLAAEGRFVQRRRGGYRLDLRDDSAASLERLLHKELAELPETDAGIMELIVPELGVAAFNPFELPRERWQKRSLRWCFHPRDYAVFLGNDMPSEAPQALALCLRLPWGEAPPTTGDVWVLQPAQLQVGDDLRELAALMRLRGRVLAPEVGVRLERRVAERLTTLRGQLSQAYRNARLMDPQGRADSGFARAEAKSFDQWLQACVLWMLRRRFPSFERFAPSHGPLPKEAYRQFMQAVSILGLEQPRSAQSGEYLDVIREGYLLPLGLLRRQGRGYEVPARLESHELIRLIQPLLEHQPVPATLYEHLAQPVYGLVPEQVHLLLIFMLIQGELDLTKAGHSYRDHWQTLPLPIQYERVVAARALGVEALKELERLCEGLNLRLPGQWTVLAQRQAVKRLRKLAGQRGQALSELARRLQEQTGAESLREQLRSHLDLWRCLRDGDEIEAWQRFLYQAGSVPRFLAEAARLAELPERLDRLASQLSRLRHLLSQAPFNEGSWAERLAQLGEMPGMDQGDELDAWLQAAGHLYQDYADGYRRAHDAWWAEAARHPAWQWRAPPLARSRHVHLEHELLEWEETRRRASGLRCRGNLNLEYQTRCRCGFDGERAPLADELARLQTLQADIEAAVAHFFTRDKVRERVQDWLDTGNELNEATQAYVRGDQALPEVADLALFDRHMGGVETVGRLRPAELLAPLAGRSWQPDELAAELQTCLTRMKVERLRIELDEEPGEPVPTLLPWALRQCLKHAEPLPDGLSSEVQQQMAPLLQPEWVGEQALLRLDNLGLSTDARERILNWLLDGSLTLPNAAAQTTSLTGAALELLRPSEPSDARELGHLAARLYRHHDTLCRVSAAAWLARLQALAHSGLAPSPPELTEWLRRDEAEIQWLVIDALGLALLELLETRIEHWLPSWRRTETAFARVSANTDTAAFYTELLRQGINRPLEKINSLDSLLHERSLPFADMERLADAEIQAACRVMAQRLDPARPLRVFADHGFRLDAQGKAYVHGGDSTLERVVPVLFLEPLGE